jgi:hypothetical protein
LKFLTERKGRVLEREELLHLNRVALSIEKTQKLIEKLKEVKI